MNNPKLKSVNKRKRFLQVLKILYFLLVVSIIATLGVFSARAIRIKDISCQSQYGPCNPQVAEELVKAKNLGLVSSKKVLTKTLSENILVKDYTIQFKLPSRFEVSLLERKARFALSNENQTQYVLVDMEGNVISSLASSNLPWVDTRDALPLIGEKVGEQTLFALNLVTGIFPYYSVSNAHLDGDSLIIELAEGPELIFPLKGDKEVLLGTSNLILTRLKSENQDSKIKNLEDIKIIDLRFKNPVLK